MFLSKKIQPILVVEVVKYVLNNKWWKGPKWLQDQAQLPEQPIVENCKEYDIKKKKIKEFLATTLTTENMFHKLLSKALLLKTLRVLSWISRFLSNLRRDRFKGPLTTNELLTQRKLIITKVELQYCDTETFKINQKQFNVKVGGQRLYQCFIRVQGEHPIFIPKGSFLAEELVEEAYILTIHGEMTFINNG